MTVYGLDISNHQGHMAGLGGVAAQFACHKLTEGTSYTDPYAADNLAWAKREGLAIRGGYHYIRQGNGGGQASYFVARARALFGSDLRGHLWQLDCEADASYADIEAFKARWDAATGGTPIFFYTGDWWLRPRGWNIAGLGFAGLWAAPNRGYVGKAANVQPADWAAGYGGFSTVTILQYDARDSVGDTNQYRGSLAQLRALLAGDTEEDEDDMDQAQFNKLLEGADIIPVHTGAAKDNPKFTLPSAVEWTYEGVKQIRMMLAALAGQMDPAAFAAKLAPLLQADGPVSQDTIEAALRNVLGSLDDAKA